MAAKAWIGRFASAVAATMVCSGTLLAQSSNDGMHDGPAMNYHRIDAQLATGGHFIGDGIGAIKRDGVEVVIDLRDQPPEGQAQRLAEAGIRWITVPVVWSAPTIEDFELFSAAFEANDEASVMVQCQANYRASAMTYLYRVKVQGVPEADARKDLHAVWTPNEVWQVYIDEVLALE